MLHESLSYPNGAAYFAEVWALLDELCADDPDKPPVEESWRAQSGDRYCHVADALSAYAEEFWEEAVLGQGLEASAIDELTEACLKLATLTSYHAESLAAAENGEPAATFGPLLLLEHLADVSHEAADALSSSDVDLDRILFARQNVLAELRPLWDAVPEAARRALLTLIEAGQAPSPFPKPTPKRRRRRAAAKKNRAPA